MGIKLLGYSERGLLNSLFYELSARDKSIELLGRLLNQAYFSGGGHAFKISEAQIFIEPSLSDFGDADTVLLIKNSGRKQTVFIEAKVKTFKKKEWLIKNEFEKFRAGVEDKKVSVSNLFAQLYQKQD